MELEDRVFYWRKGESRQNFGDYLSEYFLTHAFDGLRTELPALRLIGSVIQDGLIAETLTAVGAAEETPTLGFWACGMRDSTRLPAKQLEACRFFGVRGPLSRDLLGLPTDTTLGDSALSLPLLYEPQPSPVSGKTLCVPHILEPRSPEELREQAGADVLRSAEVHNVEQLLRLVDDIASAEFVLAGALHAAIVASAYGRPFAYWDTGYVDIPFKWLDFSASLKIDAQFVRTVAEGRDVAANRTPIHMPSGLDLLLCCPLKLRAEALERMRPRVPHEELGKFARLERELAEHVVGWAGNVAPALIPPKAESACEELAELEGPSPTELEQTSPGASPAPEPELEPAHAAERRLIDDAAAFDEVFYREQLPGEEVDDPLGHYLELGSARGLRPNRHFSPAAYLERNEDVRRQGVEPLVHYLSEGKAEGRWPGGGDAAALDRAKENTAALYAASELLDPEWYRARYPEVAASGIDPVVHYMLKGAQEGRRPSPHFDPAFYLKRYPDVRERGFEPLFHFIRFGKREGRAPSEAVAAASSGATEGEISLLRRSGLFDDGYYRDRAPGLPPELDALRYYLHEGWKTFTEPSPRFDPIYYVSQVPGARDMGPLLHFARYGHREKAKVRPSEPGEPYHFINYPPRPDDDVHIERFRGLAFFRQFRFAFEGESELALVPAAIADLARRPPPGLGDHNTPEVSIIIPVYGQTPFALGCLDSLARHRSRRRFEILVWDDASPDATKSQALEGIPWIRYIRSPENGGFLAACNAAVEQARGRYIVLLNSDTRVCSGWLDELIGTFDEHPEAGLVGSKLFFENGLLQEAGGIVWQDASATNYGRGDNSNLPEYCYARQADYCSGAAIALPRHLWDQLGGFDSFFSPAYYEDTDLAFRVRAAGRQVWYQSVAHVIHYEGKTHGRDLTAGGKRHQVTNGRKFLERWGAVLASHGEPGKRVRAAADRYTVGRLLALDEKLPTPDQDSGSVTTLRLLQLFMRLGWQVSFAPGFRFDRRYTADLHRLGIETFQTPAVPDLEAVVAREGAFDSVLAFRVDVLHPILESLRASYPQASILFHNMDFYHLRLRRQAEVEGNPRLLREAAIKHREELEVVLNVDCTIVPSDHERDVICAEAPLENVLVHPYVAEARSSRAGFSARKHLVFVGHFGHSPNVDAVRHFLTDIWPAVSGRLPSDARLYVVGADAPAALTRLARESVVFTGYVKDLASLLDTCRLMVAPLRYGAGIKGKVVTALSHGLPCVASPVAVEGMGLTPGQDVLVGDDAPGFINAVLELYSDQVRWEAVQASAYAFVQENYSWRAGESFVRDALAVAEVTWQRRQLAARYALLDQFQRSAGASLQPPAPQSEADETSLGRSAPKMLLPSKSAHPIVERRTAADEIRRFTSKSEYFEELRVPPTATHSKAKAIAFYLPQFHAIPENDDWWGRGFTEWSNVIRGTPRFPGHYQPRVPRDLGFYDLTDPTVLPRQVAAARAGGVHGFCYYYYNFGGTRLLEKPLEAMMNRSDVDFPFCLMWANENWSRRWDGYEEDVLIGHDYGDAEALVADFARHFADLRYIRIGGRPLLIIYRPGLIPGGRATFDQWRQLFADRHGERPYIFMAQAFEDYDPRKYGLDGALEFPPHKIFGDAPSIRGELEFFDPAATMQVYGYDTAIANAAATPAPPFPLFRTVFPTWDNDARRQGHGLTVTDSTPAKFGRWVDASIEYARAHPFEGEAFFFVNAWNEWAEGAYLEPDLHHGAAYLNTLGRAVQGA